MPIKNYKLKNIDHEGLQNYPNTNSIGVGHQLWITHFQDWKKQLLEQKTVIFLRIGSENCKHADGLWNNREHFKEPWESSLDSFPYLGIERSSCTLRVGGRLAEMCSALPEAGGKLECASLNIKCHPKKMCVTGWGRPIEHTVFWIRDSQKQDQISIIIKFDFNLLVPCWAGYLTSWTQ